MWDQRGGANQFTCNNIPVPKKIIPAKPLSFGRVNEKIPKKNLKSSFLNPTYSFFKLIDSFFKLKG